MHTEPDVTRIVRSWLRTDEHESAERVLGSVLAVLDATPQRQRVRPAQRFADTASIGKFAVAAAAVVVVAVVGTNLLSVNREAGGGPPMASPSPSAARLAPVALPPLGAVPSTPEHGDLVVRFEGGVVSPFTMLWVYADGRMIRHRFGDFPEDKGEVGIGLTEQRLTPEAVEFLRSAITSTGLFGKDLALAREGNAPFLEIEARNGDRLVRVTWAWRGNYKIGSTASTATPDQARTLTALNALLNDPATWPAVTWDDPMIKAYVPSRYSICFRGIPNPIEPARIVGLLPEAAQRLLRAGDWTRPDNGDCSRVTTEDARALAQILDDAGYRRNKLPGFEVRNWLRYVLEDADALRNQVWISFEPVLPHGETTWLGPG
jgi:hypothetical protein